jgi:hypothetical protein
MLSSSGIGGGRGRGGGGCGSGCGLGGAGGVTKDPLPRRGGLHCHHEMALPLGDQTHGTIANVVCNIMIDRHFLYIDIVFTSLAKYISNFSYI